VQPVLSICIPTFNRAELLGDTLERLRGLERFGMPFEVVISDNLSTDRTAAMIERRMASTPYLRFVRQRQALPVSGGMVNAAHNARGKYVIFLADDDSLLAETLMNHLVRMELESDLVAIFADWVAYDDDQDLELHRYFKFTRPVSFAPDDPLALVRFVLSNAVFPEVAIYRRVPLLQSLCFVRRGDYVFHLWMYQVSRRGRIAFELEPFYRENCHLKARFAPRAHRSSWRMRLHLIGDEMRNELEALVLLALQDAAPGEVPQSEPARYRSLINHFLLARIDLEIQRAKQAKDWLLATELWRRRLLWRGSGPEEEQRRVLEEVTLPAALQHVYVLYRSLSGVTALRLKGFRSGRIREFFALHYPEVKLLDDATGGDAEGSERPLTLYKQAADSGADSGYHVSIDTLLQSYRVNAHGVDLTLL
jgi:hypothetical protein